MWPIASLLQCLCEIEGSRSPTCSVRNSEVSWDEASRSVMSLPCPWPGVRASCTEAKGLRALVDPDEGCNWDLEGPETPVKDEIELNNSERCILVIRCWTLVWGRKLKLKAVLFAQGLTLMWPPRIHDLGSWISQELSFLFLLLLIVRKMGCQDSKAHSRTTPQHFILAKHFLHTLSLVLSTSFLYNSCLSPIL